MTIAVVVATAAVASVVFCLLSVALFNWFIVYPSSSSFFCVKLTQISKCVANFLGPTQRKNNRLIDLFELYIILQ